MDNQELDEKSKIIYARSIEYELKGEKIKIHAFAIDDGGYQFEFYRGVRTYPLRLSKTGMEALIALYQDMVWNAPPIPTAEDQSTDISE